MAEAATTFRPELAVLSAVAARGFEDCAEELAALSREQPVAIAGAGASHELAARLGCDFLEGDPVAAAVALSEDYRP